jgi:hypothetical protein
MQQRTPAATMRLKQLYRQKAIKKYEYSWAPEYEKRGMTRRAIRKGTVNFDWQDAEVELAPDGAWVTASVWCQRSGYNQDGGAARKSPSSFAPLLPCKKFSSSTCSR